MQIHCGDFIIWALCMDEQSAQILQKMQRQNIRIVSLPMFEKIFPQLYEVKNERTKIEYYFTSTPFLPSYVFKIDPTVELITYIDADIYFFSNPEPLFEELANNSIGIIEHRFPDNLKEKYVHGKYNVGWLTFRKDVQGTKSLAWWQTRCLEWCHDYYEDGKFGDQKYLDDWPERFSGVKVLNNKGANLAPWNVANYSYTIHEGKVFVDNDELIFFHFHGVRRLFGRIYDSGLGHYKCKLNKLLRAHIYLPYVFLLEKKCMVVDVDIPSLKTVRIPLQHTFLRRQFVNIKWWLYFITKVFLKRNYLILR